MKIISNRPGTLALIALLAMPMAGTLSAQELEPAQGEAIATVIGATPTDLAGLPEGPEIEGFISARRGNTLQVTSADGAATAFLVADVTEIRASKGLFSRKKLASDSLLNGLPVSVKTVQWEGGLVASKINFRNTDFKTARMIRNGTAQGFAEQTAATEALRGRMADIDQYNLKSTTNVFFDTGKAVLSEQAKNDICATAHAAEGMPNAQMLVVGYTDSVGSEEYNQTLSEKRAGRVVNYLQQACGWKPFRMLTPTGMAEADPMASNDTYEGKAQNRRVSLNILVSKGLDGM